MVATEGDVEARLGRSLRSPDEAELATLLIDDAERMIAKQAPDGDIVALGIAAIKQVVGGAVARILRNPEGYRSQTAGGLSVTIDTRVAAGFLTILDEEWTLLGLSAPSAQGGAFSIAPRLGTPPPLWPSNWTPLC